MGKKGPYGSFSPKEKPQRKRIILGEAFSLRKLFFSIIIIISSCISAIAAPGEVLPQSLAQGGASVTKGSIEAVFGNPAGLRDANALFLGSQTYGLSLTGTSFALAKAEGGLGARILASPDPAAWGGTDLLLWAGKSFPLGKNVQGGVALSGFLSSGPNIAGNGAMLDTGFLWHRGQGKVGLLWRNIAAIESWRSYQGKSWYAPPRQAVLGLAWAGENLGAAVDLFPEGELWRWQVGVNFSLFGMDLRCGYDGTVSSFGAALDTGLRIIEYSWRGGQTPMGYLGLKFKL